MPTIEEMTYGYSTAGVEKYIEEIKTSSLNKAIEALDNTEDLIAAIDNEWLGTAREGYITQLNADKEHVKTQLNTLVSNLESEINSLNAAMANFDEGLIKE